MKSDVINKELNFHEKIWTSVLFDFLTILTIFNNFGFTWRSTNQRFSTQERKTFDFTLYYGDFRQVWASYQKASCASGF